MFANGGCIASGPVGVDPHVAANAPTPTLQLLQKRTDEGLKSCIIRGCGEEYANTPHALALLRAHWRGPCNRRHPNAEKRDELAPPHVPPSRLGTRQSHL